MSTFDDIRWLCSQPSVKDEFFVILVLILYLEPAVNPKLSVVKQKEQRSLFVKVSQNKSAGSDRQVGMKLFWLNQLWGNFLRE